MARPTTLADICSSDATSRSSSSDVTPPTAVTPSIAGAPVVRVPVLSSSTARARPSCSMAPDPLAMIPRRAARERPESSATGAARISGHGVATTSTASARTGSPLSAQAPTASTRVTGRRIAA